MKFGFIRDEETNLETDDLLGTNPYANTLLEVIKDSKTPFTIGLFGGWGTGKSSIIKTIKEKLNNAKSSKVKVFVYDAWKYSKDPFRRTFLLEFLKDFGLNTKEIRRALYSSKTKNTNWGISRVISYSRSESISTEKLIEHEKFEGIFKESIAQITNDKKISWKYFKELIGYEKKIDKIVIVIDNIDRCHENLAFELLLTIKNFLEQKNVIFIIPIDECELKKHIQKEGHDGNEFLRKLFNTTLTIKKFSEDDLFYFAQDLKEKYKLDLNNNVLSLISQEFSKSPRKIIQFLNVIQTEIKLAEEQEKDDNGKKSNFKKGIITDNIEFLVKIILIREEWANVYEKLKENPFLLADINQQIDSGDQQIIYAKDNNGKQEILTDEQRRFFESTRDIFTENIEAFFANRDAFLGVPDDVPRLVLSQDWETLKIKYLEKDIFDLNKLIEFIDSLYKKEVEQKGLLGRSGFNIFSLIFKISEDKKYGKDLLDCFYGAGKSLLSIRSKLNSAGIKPIILSFNPALLLDFIRTDLNRNKRLNKEVLNTLNDKDNDTEKHYSLLMQFINKFQDDGKILKKIKESFSDSLRESPYMYNDFRDLLKKELVAKSLIKYELLEEFIKGLEQDPNSENTEDQLRIINEFYASVGLTNKLFKQFIEKIIGFMKATNDLKILSFWFKELIPLVKNIKDDELEANLLETLNLKNEFLWQQYNSQWNTEEYQTTLEGFLELSNEFYILSKVSASEVGKWFNNFLSRNESPDLAIKMSKLLYKTIKYFKCFDWLSSDQIIDKFNQLPEWENKKEIAETLNLMLLKTTSEKGLKSSQIQRILRYYIDSLNKDEESVKKWLLGAIKNLIVKTELEGLIRGFSINEKLNLLEIINQIDKDLSKESVEEIITETVSNELGSVFEKLNNTNISLALIRGAIKNILKDFNKEDLLDGYFELFIDAILQNNLTDQTISNTLASKLKPMLSSNKKEDVLFALNSLDKISISDSGKKKMIKGLLNDLDISEFSEEEILLYKRVKKKK